MPTRGTFQNLANKLINQTFGDFRDPVVLQQVVSDYATQSDTIAAFDNTFGIRLEYNKAEVDGQSIQQGDYKVLIEQQPLAVDVRADNVKMTFNSKAVDIISVSEDAARAVYTLQVRDL